MYIELFTLKHWCIPIPNELLCIPNVMNTPHLLALVTFQCRLLCVCVSICNEYRCADNSDGDADSDADNDADGGDSGSGC